MRSYVNFGFSQSFARNIVDICLYGGLSHFEAGGYPRHLFVGNIRSLYDSGFAGVSLKLVADFEADVGCVAVGSHNK